MRWLFVVGFVAALASVPGLAQADAIMGPPACPDGAHGRSSHSGTWCEPTPCSSDADCSGGASCEPLRVCTVTARVSGGGRRRSDVPDGPPVEIQVVVASCDVSSGCSGTEETWPPTPGYIADRTPRCADANHCVPPRLPSLGGFFGSSTPSPASTGPSPAPTTTPSTTTPTPSSGGCSARSGTNSPLLWVVAMLFVSMRRRARGAPGLDSEPS